MNAKIYTERGVEDEESYEMAIDIESNINRETGELESGQVEEEVQLDVFAIEGATSKKLIITDSIRSEFHVNNSELSGEHMLDNSLMQEVKANERAKGECKKRREKARMIKKRGEDKESFS